MPGDLLQLYPPSSDHPQLQGLYLQHPLHRLTAADAPLVYSNFISSLDGRIALPSPGRTSHRVPPAIGNARDWRLYQELGAQADLLITSARYFRQLAQGEAQDLLPVGPADRFGDLQAWRRANGLGAQPDLAIFSASLEIPAEAIAIYAERRLHVMTGAGADRGRIAALQAAGIEVHQVGGGATADGGLAIAALQAAGYRRIYAIAGPSVFHALVCAGVLNRLYISFAHRLLGGKDFDTVIWGPELAPAPILRLRSLFYDAHAPADAGQLLACYDLPTPTSTR
ncbi:MAG: dihydrofolate reductase family protein [Gammaproteobacteria bacterium]|nr:dihydrofolate reductase family protein [Gammaproteobacteria bacterium]